MQGVENVSTLMDGELDSDEAAREIVRFKQDAARRDTWNTYHIIGDAMRGEYSRAGLSTEFSKRLSERLALEPTVVAPHLRAPKSVQTWALSAAASVAAVAAVGWMAMNTLNTDGTTGAPGTLAKAPAANVTKAPVVALQPAGPTLVEPVAAAPEHMHEYLLAHQGISPSTAIQGVTPYIRTVSNVGNEPGLR
ncbi:MAG: sigma-E factor negative regulatory protein [Burkholderiales bacterium]